MKTVEAKHLVKTYRNGEVKALNDLSLDVEEVELRARLANRAKDSGRPDDADPKVIQNRIFFITLCPSKKLATTTR